MLLHVTQLTGESASEPKESRTGRQGSGWAGASYPSKHAVDSAKILVQANHVT